jgi:hypothetical protein
MISSGTVAKSAKYSFRIPASVARPEIIYRNTSWEDPELGGKGLGRLEVVVRVADRPTQVVQGADVWVRPDGDTGRSRRRLTDLKGVVTFDSAAVGSYEMIIRAIGYGVGHAQVVVSPGCRTDVEVYIGVFAIGIAPPPPEPARVRVTTCRPTR